MNRYEKLIEHLRKKEPAIVNSGIPFHKHRILPSHQGGTYDQENVVICTVKDHIQAHKVRYEVYKQVGDKFAVSMMTGRLMIGERVVTTLGALATHEVCKFKKTGFWSSETQRKNAIKGNTKETLKAKSEGGKRGNKIIRLKCVGIYAPDQASRSGRASGLKRWGIKFPLYGRLLFDNESRVSLSDTFFDYYVIYGSSKVIPSQASDASEEGVETSR